MRRINIKLPPEPAMRVSRVAIKNEQLVYVICADKKIVYPWGKSPIAYIGTTQRGVGRIASSAAYRAPDVLAMHGVKSFDVRIVTCGSRADIKSWKVLERALLICFKETFGAIPKCNTQGKQVREGNVFEIFARDRVKNIISNLTEHGQAKTHEISL